MAVNSVIRFLQEVQIELSKVVWPKWEDFVGATVVVLVLVSFFALYLGFVDLMFSRLARYIFHIYGGF